MLKLEDIEVRVTNKNIKYYSNFVENISNGMLINIKSNNLSLGSHVKITGICDICGVERCLEYKSYNTQTNNGSGIFTCSKKCSIEKTKITNLNNYGVENTFQCDIVKNKIKEVMLERYGADNPQKCKTFVDKRKKTSLEKYGFEHPSSSEKVKEKVKLKNIEKFGFDYPAKSIEILEKMKSTNLIRYGVDSYTKTKFFKIQKKDKDFLKKSNKFKKYGELLHSSKLSMEFCCDKCNGTFKVSKSFAYIRDVNNEALCIFCNPILHNKSKMESELFDFISFNYKGIIKKSDRDILNGKELDIYLTELNLAFEFNGLYWHSELFKGRNYHINKTNKCLEQGINLIHIWEDDWIFRQDIVKSMILHKLGKSKKIFARKCEIKTPNNKDVREFLINNHIQGFVGSNIKLGLYFEDELVSLMTFGNLRKSLGQVSSEGSYELLRFCNKLGYSIIGGASKLFKYFLNNYDVKEITSYSDSSRGVGNLYKLLNFEFIHESTPNYYYIINGVKKHRFNFRKDKLIREGGDPNKTEVQIMNEKGYFRIFDSGCKKWTFSI